MVVAAGAGDRFGARKQFAPLGSRRVVDWSLTAARAHSAGVVLVLPADAIPGDGSDADADVVVAGGATRSQSVREGLRRVPPEVTHVLVHDAARPVAPDAVWMRVLDALKAGADVVVPAVAVADSLREIGGGPVDRARLVAVQTPQGFSAAALRAAHGDDGEATDDASLAEAAGYAVVVVDGDASNIKITRPVDLVIAEALIAR